MHDGTRGDKPYVANDGFGVMTATNSSVPAGALIRGPIALKEQLELGEHLWGFGGVHGGLVVALLTSAMQEQVPTGELRSVTARFHRAVRGPFRITTETVHSGRSFSTLAGQVTTEEGVHVDVSATFGSPTAGASWPAIAPEPPPVPPPEDCPVFSIPPEFVPIGSQIEIRPVDANRPYAGCAEPELSVWIRLVEDDEPPSPQRFVFLMDALAPSYAAVLSDLVLIPTVEMSVHPTEDLGAMASPWVLMRARSHTASASGWVNEQIDAWARDGIYLGSAQQLRLVRSRR